MDQRVLNELVAAELARRNRPREHLDFTEVAGRVADELGLPTRRLDDIPWADCTESSRSHQTLRTITPRHQEAARLNAAGVSAAAISEELGVARKTVSNWLQDPKIELLTTTLQAGRDRAATEASKRIQELQATAVETLAQLLDEDAPPTVRLGAARDLLDRGGNAAPKQVQVSSVSAQLTLDDVAELQRRLRGPQNEGEPES